MMLFSLIFENVRHDLKASDGKLAILTQSALLFFLLTLSLTSASIQLYLDQNLTQMLGSDLVLEQHGTVTSEQETCCGPRRQKFPRQSLWASHSRTARIGNGFN